MTQLDCGCQAEMNDQGVVMVTPCERHDESMTRAVEADAQERGVPFVEENERGQTLVTHYGAYSTEDWSAAVAKGARAFWRKRPGATIEVRAATPERAEAVRARFTSLERSRLRIVCDDIPEST